jgi:hypothetical protein
VREAILVNGVAELGDEGDEVGQVVGADPAEEGSGSHAGCIRGGACRFREVAVKLWRRAGAAC